MSHFSRIILAVHGGAGNISPELQNTDLINQRLAAMRQFLSEAYQAWQQHSSAVDLSTMLVKDLEDYPEFNAGHGAVLTEKGTVELDASIMNGSSSQAGSVCCVKQVKNPILGARKVMESSDHVMLTADGADLFCAEQGLPYQDNHLFITQPRYQQWFKYKDCKSFETCIDTQTLGTVGAVALDDSGNLAAATSTGGRLNQKLGRVGDSPVIGAGTWASNKTCAVSATGDGEIFLRTSFAHQIASRMEYLQQNLAKACEMTLNQVAQFNGCGGCIAIDHQGYGAMMFNTNAMYYGYANEDGEIHVDLLNPFNN